jgi:hypothetical protein
MTFHRGNQTILPRDESRGKPTNGLKGRYPGHDNGIKTLDQTKDTDRPTRNSTVNVRETFQRENQTILVPESTHENPMNGIEIRTTFSLGNP